MKSIPIHTDYITLGQMLKLGDCIATGGHAKHFLQDANVQVNGIDDNRRGRKLYPGDKVSVQGCGEFIIIADGG
jgi:ribosome-associated protein